MKPCPKCFKKVCDEALVCENCGYQFIDSLGRKRVGVPTRSLVIISAACLGFLIALMVISFVRMNPFQLRGIFGQSPVTFFIVSVLGMVTSSVGIGFVFLFKEDKNNAFILGPIGVFCLLLLILVTVVAF